MSRRGLRRTQRHGGFRYAPVLRVDQQASGASVPPSRADSSLQFLQGGEDCLEITGIEDALRDE